LRSALGKLLRISALRIAFADFELSAEGIELAYLSGPTLQSF
jgi:hypothetical protein